MDRASRLLLRRQGAVGGYESVQLIGPDHVSQGSSSRECGTRCGLGFARGIRLSGRPPGTGAFVVGPDRFLRRGGVLGRARLLDPSLDGGGGGRGGKGHHDGRRGGGWWGFELFLLHGPVDRACCLPASPVPSGRGGPHGGTHDHGDRDQRQLATPLAGQRDRPVVLGTLRKLRRLKERIVQTIRTGDGSRGLDPRTSIGIGRRARSPRMAARFAQPHRRHGILGRRITSCARPRHRVRVRGSGPIPVHITCHERNITPVGSRRPVLHDPWHFEFCATPRAPIPAR